eukprot:Lithocolla_globosa_v1_NODE_579_length_3692_cov_95.718999.p1 type:complete len:306 gc:universal NODE_579_length_3692_cov_95.718999:1997-1080(-)
MENLAKIQVGELLSGKERRGLLSVSSSSTIEEYLNLLKENNVLSLPVLDEKDELVGMVDLVDVVKFLLDRWHHAKAGRPQDVDMKIKIQFFKRTIQDILAQQTPGTVRSVSILATMADLLEYFALTRTHRVIVLDNEGKHVDVISQSDVVRFFSQKLSEVTDLPSSLTGPISDHFDHCDPVVMMRSDDPVISVLKVLNSRHVPALALLNRELAMTGVFSLSDLRGLGTNDIAALKGSVWEYKSRVPSRSGVPITCQPETSLLEIMKIVSEQKVHRSFICNQEGHPLRVVTLTDMLTDLHHLTTKN